MEIFMQKIGMIRQEINLKNSSFNLDIDWSVDYIHIDQKNIGFDLMLKSLENFNSSFKIEGTIKLNSNEEFVQEEISQIIFQKACSIFMDIISITRESTHILSKTIDSSGCGSEHIPSTLFN